MAREIRKLISKIEVRGGKLCRSTEVNMVCVIIYVMNQPVADAYLLYFTSHHQADVSY